MQFVRRFDEAQAVETGYRGYSAQTVSHQESALIIGSWIAGGGCGPELHYHDSDQSYFLVSGAMKVRIDSAVHDVQAGSFVHIPAGVAHCNWNETSDTEFHFELIVPAPKPGAPLLHFVESPSDAPGSDRTGFVRTTDDDDFQVPEAFPGMGFVPLLTNDNSVVNAIRVAPGGSGPGAHIHEFDQYYVVLEGTLQVEVALERHSAPAGSVVLLPAGVPHRQWNEGPEREAHLALLAPAPRDEVPWDRGVDFAFNGQDHS
ncbi:cupin domain-containing protein [Streptomyces bobili]|uniref:cupin domain-containing protein n=1 Tax=Streptomyces bobili TaxID=67280 RepID=UPI0036657490